MRPAQREVEFALPHELSDEASIELARTFVRAAFVEQDMIADLNVHKPVDASGQAKPHAHVLLTLPSVAEDGFGAKVRAWNGRGLPDRWRDMLADLTNRTLSQHGVGARVDPRSFEERGIELEPQLTVGWAARKLQAAGLVSERMADSRAPRRATASCWWRSRGAGSIS